MENANQSLVEAGSTVQEVRKNAKCSAVLGILWKHQKCQLEETEKKHKGSRCHWKRSAEEAQHQMKGPCVRLGEI